MFTRVTTYPAVCFGRTEILLVVTLVRQEQPSFQTSGMSSQPIAYRGRGNFDDVVLQGNDTR